jgi:ComF family protein
VTAPADSWSPRGLLARLVDLLFPPRCGGCGRLGAWFCAACVTQIEPPIPPGWVCGGCGATPLGTCRDRRCRQAPLAGLLVVGAFEGPLREAIHALKYRKQRALAPALAGLLAVALAHNPLPGDAPAPQVLAVPLHPMRIRERGFSQSTLLAEALAAQQGCGLVAGLVRARATPPQVGLPADARRANVIGAFAWNGDHPPPACPLLLVDDVYTTGATMTAAATALQAHGAGRIYGLALARPRTI